MSGSVQVWLNGEARAVVSGTTLGQLVAALGLEPKTLLVECNGEVLPREVWGRTGVADGDRIELFRVSAGG